MRLKSYHAIIGSRLLANIKSIKFSLKNGVGMCRHQTWIWFPLRQEYLLDFLVASLFRGLYTHSELVHQVSRYKAVRQIDTESQKAASAVHCHLPDRFSSSMHQTSIQPKVPLCSNFHLTKHLWLSNQGSPSRQIVLEP